MSRLLKYVHLVFLNRFIQKLCCDVYAFLSEKISDFLNLFLRLDFFTMVLCEASFVRIYFLLIRAFLLKIKKIVFLKTSLSGAPKSNLEISEIKFSF